MQVGADRKPSRKLKKAAMCLGAATLTGLIVANAPTEGQVRVIADSPTPDILAEVVRGGEAGFVVTEIAFVLGPDAKDSAACPAGMTSGVRGLVEAFAKTSAGMRQDSESSDAYSKRLFAAVNTTPDGQNICLHPEASSPDPGWKMVSGKGVKVDGIDLDGQDSASARKPASGTCGHQDFDGPHGRRGIDNQWFRVIGCTTGFQSTGQGNNWQNEMYTGSWGVLIKLKGVNNVRNDPQVEVGIYANADPIQLSAARAALPFATYAAAQDPKYRATTRGRIVNGVLTIDPVDVRFPNIVNSMTDERVLRDARLHLTFTADGGMEGFLGGYTPIEDMYNVQFGARVSRTAKGELAPEGLRMRTSVGRAGALGHSCNGAYYALKQAADGHPDASGRCTSISTQYRIRIAPAFVVDAKTRSENAPLAFR